jgi:hypothetical protein
MIEIEQVRREQAPTVENAAGLARVTLGPNVRYAKSGCPIRPTDGGWVPARDGYGELVVVDGGYGGESVQAARLLCLNLNRKTFGKFPTRLRIKDIDDNGGLVFDEADSGPYLAVDDRRILMDMSYAALYGILSTIAMRIKETQESVAETKALLDRVEFVPKSETE